MKGHEAEARRYTHTHSGTVVLKNYKLSKELGSGAFGKIYLATCLNNQEQTVAVKLEDVQTKSPQLSYEYKLYRYLQNNSDKDNGLPKVFFR